MNRFSLAMLAAVLVVSCHTSPVIRDETPYQREALHRYEAGELTWTQYQDALKHESENSP